MKKHFLLLTIFILGNITLSAQNLLGQYSFEKKYFEVVDNWIMHPSSEQNNDFIYSYGFIYFDEAAGFTFHFEGTFRINENGTFIKEKTFGNVKIRLDIDWKLVEIIPKERLEDLNLQQEPEWLESYKKNNNTTDYLYRLGYAYNAVGGSAFALEPLYKAYSLEPTYNGLIFELVYALNATKQYEKAVPLLEQAIKLDSNEFYLYRELGYALSNLQRLEEADKVYKESLLLTTNSAQKSEVGINMVQAYYRFNNKEKFEEWYKLTKKYASPDSELYQYLELFKKEMDKQNPQNN